MSMTCVVAAVVCCFGAIVTSSGAEDGRPEEKVFLNTFLADVGPRFTLYFSIEYDRRGENPISPLDMLYLDEPKDLRSSDDVVAYLRKHVTDANVAVDAMNPNVVHIVEKTIDISDSVLGSRVSVEVKGTPSQLLGKLKVISAGVVREPTWFIVGSPMTDRVTPVEVNVKDKPIRSVLSRAVASQGYSPILWTGEYRREDSKILVDIRFHGQQPSPPSDLSRE